MFRKIIGIIKNNSTLDTCSSPLPDEVEAVFFFCFLALDLNSLLDLYGDWVVVPQRSELDAPFVVFLLKVMVYGWDSHFPLDSCVGCGFLEAEASSQQFVNGIPALLSLFLVCV